MAPVPVTYTPAPDPDYTLHLYLLQTSGDGAPGEGGEAPGAHGEVTITQPSTLPPLVYTPSNLLATIILHDLLPISPPAPPAPPAPPSPHLLRQPFSQLNRESKQLP